MRIQKYLSQKRIVSRREAEGLIKQGLIKVNGKVVRELGGQIDPDKDRVEVVASGKEAIQNKITVAVYKPRGIVSSKNSREGKTIFELLPQFSKLNAVGRLDKASEGLILLSNDGVVTAAVTGSDHLIEKEYEVSVREEVSSWHLKKLSGGILLEDGPTLPAKAKLINKHKFTLILKEGRNHQIRRMADALHLTITQLKRVRIGALSLKGLSAGGYRALSGAEVLALKQLAGH